MDAEKAQELLEQAMGLDPREAAFGICTGGSFVLDTVRVFCWFRSRDDLAYFLKEVQPVIYEFEDEDVGPYQAEIKPLLQTISRDELTESLRARLNETVSDIYCVDWWGTLEELQQGKTEFSRQIIGRFRDDENNVTPIENEEIDDFLEFLITYSS